jgi:hypothetical protein
MTHLVLLECDDDGNAVIQNGKIVGAANYGPITKADFEKRYKDGHDSQQDWIVAFELFHVLARELGIWDENGFQWPYDLGSFVQFGLKEFQNPESIVIPAEFKKSMTGYLARKGLGLMKSIGENDSAEIKFNLERFKVIAEEFRKLLVKNVQRNPELLEKIHGITMLQLPSENGNQ